MLLRRGHNALREFYEACGLSPATIEGQSKRDMRGSNTIAYRDRAVAEVMAKRLREQIVEAGVRREASRRKRSGAV